MSEEKQWDLGALSVLRQHVEAEQREADREGMPEREQTLQFVDDVLLWMLEQPVTDRPSLGAVIEAICDGNSVNARQEGAIVALLNILRRY